MSKPDKDPCKPCARRIEACLQKNNFQEHKCADVLEQMRQCCLKWHKESFCCNGINLEKSYLKNDEKESKVNKKQ